MYESLFRNSQYSFPPAIKAGQFPPFVEFSLSGIGMETVKANEPISFLLPFFFHFVLG